MEILQTIWTALTTENELFATIILLPETFLENFINMLIFTTFLDIKSDKHDKIKYVIIISVLCDVFNLIIPNPYRSILNLLSILICIKIIFHTNILKTILGAIIPILFTVLCESLLMKICVLYLGIDSINVVSIPLYRFIVTLIIQALMFLIYWIIRYLKIQISILEGISSKNKTIIVINFIFAIIAIVVQFLITGFYIGKLPLYIVIFSNLSLIIYFVLSIFTIMKIMQLESTALNLEQEKENNRRLKEFQDELHGFRHDFSNIMCTISGYIQVNDMEGLTKYYSEIQKDINKVNTLGALNPDIINNPAIYILISSKYSRALEENIETNINIFLDLNKLNMKIYEFTRILGILLDNAIEAAKECDEKIITLEIRKDTNHNRQLLILENTYLNKDIDTERIFEKKYSTKEGNSGLGLWEVRQILKRNNNLNLFTSKTDKYFKQQLEIYN